MLASQAAKYAPPDKPAEKIHPDGHEDEVYANGEEEKESRKHDDLPTKMTPGHLFHIIHRLLVLVAAIFYIVRSIDAAQSMFEVLDFSLGNQDMSFPAFALTNIGNYIGTTTMRQSPLLTLLGNVTTLRNDTLYLDDDTTNFNACTTVKMDSTLYGNAFLRTMLATFVADTSYNFTFLSSAELIMPIVDCSFYPIAQPDNSNLRIYYLMRSKTNFDDVYLMTFSLSTQDYSIPAQNQKGPAGIAMFSYVDDLTTTSITHNIAIALGYPFGTLSFEVYVLTGIDSNHRWLLSSVPQYPLLETSKDVVTACRAGFYVQAETEQSNVNNMYWALETSPLNEIKYWNWDGGAVLNDSWAWVHAIHIYFAADTIFNLLVLSALIYRNFRKGKLWVGDAFASISNSLVLRGTLVIFTWYINGFWTITEYSLHNAYDLWGGAQLFVYTKLIRADLMTVYMSVAGGVGYIMRERIDPALVVLIYEIAFQYRVSTVDGLKAIHNALIADAKDDFDLGYLGVDTTILGASPMTYWTIHVLSNKSAKLIFSTLLPIFITIIAVVVFAFIRKIDRVFRPEKLHVIKVTSYSDKKELLLAQKGAFTMFEIATGAALQVRYGVVSDYENCVFIRGVKYASADGIYCSGYLIANGKFLIATEDLLTIIIMKIIRVRFRNVYVYEVSERTVQQTARLVYPQTISFVDLMNLDIGLLS